MKKLLVAVLSLALILGFTGCNNKKEDPNAKSEGVMTYAEYAAAELGSEVTIEAYVQAKQDWWQGAAQVYTQDGEGGYFLYNLACTEEEYAKLTVGTKIRVKGYKDAWAGEVEIVDGKFEIIEGNYVATPLDVTSLIGKAELEAKQNLLVTFKGVTVLAYDETGVAFVYKNAENKTDDLYFKVAKDGVEYEFCVEYYLCNESTDVYKAVEGLKVGDVVDLVGFLYWYNGPNLHTTSLTVSK